MTTTGTAAIRAIGYIRVSTAEQGESGAGLAAQRAAIEAECARRGWTLIEIIEDVASGKNLARPGMARALSTLDTGGADILLGAKVDRLSRSVLDFAALLDRAGRHGWKLVALDLGVDTSTPSGELFAAIVAALAQYERKLIGQRTREALAQKRAEGVRLGRPPALGDDVVARIVAEYAAGRGLTAIARGLNADAVPTAQGGAMWRASTVQAVLRRASAAA